MKNAFPAHILSALLHTFLYSEIEIHYSNVLCVHRNKPASFQRGHWDVYTVPQKGFEVSTAAVQTFTGEQKQNTKALQQGILQGGQ